MRLHHRDVVTVTKNLHAQELDKLPHRVAISVFLALH